MLKPKNGAVRLCKTESCLVREARNVGITLEAVHTLSCGQNGIPAKPIYTGPSSGSEYSPGIITRRKKQAASIRLPSDGPRMLLILLKPFR